MISSRALPHRFVAQAYTVSSLLHVIGFVMLIWIAQNPMYRTSSPPIRVKIVEPAAPPVVAEPPPRVVPKERPKPPPRSEAPAAPQSPPTPQRTESVQPVQGLRPEALSDNPAAPVAPVGNTLMVEDEGKRLNADQVQQLGTDQSANARLIQDSFIVPEYTPAALDANIEGSYIVDMYVDADGTVVDAQLRKPIGFGMDERVLAAAKSARFVPRKNRLGGAIAGWTELRFTLTIP